MFQIDPSKLVGSKCYCLFKGANGGNGLISLVENHPLWGRLQRTSGKWGGGGFEISDIPGRGEGGGL